MSKTRAFRCCLVLLALGAASAQISEQQALSNLKLTCAAGLAAIKADLKTAATTLHTELAAFEADIADGGSALDSLSDIFDALQGYQADVIALVEENGLTTDTAICLILVDLEGGGDLDGHYPRDFYPHGGGTVEKYQADVRKALEKSCVTANKRLKKTVAQVLKHNDVALNILLAVPAALRDTAVGAGAIANPDSFPATLDLLIAASELGTEDDGVLCVGGSADSGLGNVAIAYRETFGADVNEVATPEFDTKRWGVISDNGGAGLVEGNYTASAQQGTDGLLVTGSIGVR